MLSTILVPLDGSAWSAQALPVAQAIATQAHAQLDLLHVHMPVVTSYVEGVPLVDDALDAAAFRNDAAYLKALQQELAASGLAVSVEVCDDDVVSAIAAKAQALKADLLVMTTHGRSGVARAWMGSVANAVMRRSHVPLLLIRPTDSTPRLEAQRYARILVPLDGSAAAEQALTPAIALGTVTGAEYQLLQIVEAFSGGDQPFMPHMPTALDAGLHSRITNAETYLDEVAARLSAQGLQVSTQVLVAEHTAQAIALAADEHCADLIAMATHGRGGVARLVLGSVADTVVRCARHPVLLIRP